MSKSLQEMSTVARTAGGVQVRIQGEVRREAIEGMIGGCATGGQACCGPEFFARVKGIDVSGRDGDVVIDIQGEQVTEAMVEQNLARCDCYRP